MKKKVISIFLIMALLVSMLTACSGSDSGNTETETESEKETQELTSVNVGMTPYSMYAIWAIAKDMGIDKEFGLDLNLVNCTSTANGATLLVGNGDVDISASCISEHLACVETADNIVNFSVIGDFTGFFYVGREDTFTSWEEILEEYDGDEAAAKEARLKEFSGKSICCIPQRKAMIIDTISQVGLTESDITLVYFADDAKAANALLTGEGDMYIGSLPQQKALMKEDGFVNVGGTEILGASGLWYDTMMTTKEYLDDNWDTSKKILACYFATVNEFYKDSEACAEIASKWLTENSGSEFTVEDWLDMQQNYDVYQTLEMAAEEFYNPESDRYWKVSAEAQMAQLVSDGTLTNPKEASYYYEQSQKLFDEVYADETLVDMIDAHK